jgi:hypothetical protein
MLSYCAKRQVSMSFGTVYNYLTTDRGEHVTDKMIDGPDSVAFDEAKRCLRARNVGGPA